MDPDIYIFMDVQEVHEMLKDMVKIDLRKTLIQYERIRPVYHDIAAIKDRPGFMSS